MALNVKKLNIKGSTTIQESILTQQTTADSVSIPGTINEIIDKAGTGGGGGEKYSGSKSIGITTGNSIFVKVADSDGEGMNQALTFQHIDRPTQLDGNQVYLNFTLWPIDYYDFGPAVTLVRPSKDNYITLWDDRQTNMEKLSIRWFVHEGQQWDQNQWAKGFIIWFAGKGTQFMEQVSICIDDTSLMKTTYSSLAGEQTLDFTNLRLSVNHPSYGNENMFPITINDELDNKLPDTIECDTSNINWSVPGIYPIYLNLKGSSNKTQLNITVQ